ncbi:MAG: hypothetical protein JWP75_3531 [Frondihabitans sp.]|nr:hypothetical protein [Frondihabitans sp.]
MVGPVEEGSITAKIKADASQYKEELQSAEAMARELGATDPTIRVEADTAGAMAKIEAVKAVEGTLGGGLPDNEISRAQGVQDAYKKLSYAIDNEGAAAMRAASAHAKMDEQLGDSNVTLSTYQSTIAKSIAADAAARKATDNKATALENYEKEIEKADNALNNMGRDSAKINAESEKSIGLQGALVSGVAALITILPQLVEYTAAAGGGMVAMGATGVLAYEGIKKAMADGSQEGQDYKSAIAGITTEFNALSATAAIDVLSAFQKAEREIVGDMPSLNADVGVFAGLLGETGDNLVDGLVKGLQAAMPLLVDGAQYIERLSSSVDSFAGSSQFADFITAARAELPQVEQFVDSTGTAVVRLGIAIAPVGREVLTVVNAFTALINATPVPVLEAIAGTAATVGAGFLAWKAVYPILKQTQAGIDLLSGSNLGLVTTTYAAADAEDTAAASSIALGSALDFATGPVGLVLAGAGALAAVLVGTASASSSAAGATDEYTEALQEDSGAIGDNVKAQAAKALADSGAFESAKSLGISQSTLTDAVLGNASAQKTVTDAINTNGKTVIEQTNRFGTATGKITEYSSAADKVRSVVEGQSGALKLNIQQYKDIATALGLTASTSNGTAAANAKLVASMTAESNAATIVTDALALMNGKTLDLAQAQTGFAAANNSLTASFKSNGTAIDGTTDKAVANQQAMQQSITAAQSLAQATFTATGSQDKATQSLAASKAAIEKQLASQGDLTHAVQHYIDTEYQIPKSWTTKLNADQTAAAAAIAGYKKLMASIPAGVSTTLYVDATSAMSKIQAVQAAYNNIANSALISTPQVGPSSASALSGASRATAHKALGGLVSGPGNAFTDTAMTTALSNGEFVVSNEGGQVTRNMGLLQSINSGQTPKIHAISTSSNHTTASHQPMVHIINKSGANLADLIDLHIDGKMQDIGQRSRYAQVGRRRLV